MWEKTCLTAALAFGTAAVLAGCGGGHHVDNLGDAEGAWYTANGSTATQMVILSNGALWGIYGSDATVAGIQGMLNGSADIYGVCFDYYDDGYYDDDGNWVTDMECDEWVQFPTASGSLTQFDMSGNAAPAINWYFSGQAQETQTLAIALTDDKNKKDDSDSSGPAWTMFYDNRYDTVASVSSFAGDYAGWTAVSGQAPHNLTGIAISGSTLTLPADDAGCSATGTLTPHKGKASSSQEGSPNTVIGVLDVKLTFNGSGCALGNRTTVQGVTIPPNSTVNGSAQLQIVATTSDAQNGFMLVANRR